MEPPETQSVSDRRKPRPTSTKESTTEIAKAKDSESLAANEKIPHCSDQSGQVTGETHRDYGVPSTAWKVYTLEMASLLLATLAFGSTIVMLATRDGQERPNWPHLPNINTLASILTTILKAALLLPVAWRISGMGWDRLPISQPQRGADRWERGRGYLKVAGRNLSRNWLILLGAVLALLALAIDPFY